MASGLREAALKLKEIANRPAAAFSGAEFLHGPVALMDPDRPRHLQKVARTR